MNLIVIDYNWHCIYMHIKLEILLTELEKYGRRKSSL